MFKDLRPSTVIVLVVLCALIFVPAFFLDVGTMGKGDWALSWRVQTWPNRASPSS